MGWKTRQLVSLIKLQIFSGIHQAGVLGTSCWHLLCHYLFLTSDPIKRLRPAKISAKNMLSVCAMPAALWWMVLKRLGVRHDGGDASGTDCCPLRWFLFATKQVILFDFANFTLIDTNGKYFILHPCEVLSIGINESKIARIENVTYLVPKRNQWQG